MISAMKCPVCQVDLKIAERAGIEIDYCPNCRGVWLDRGELDKIIERYAQSSDPVDAPPSMPRSTPPSAPPPSRSAPYPYEDEEPSRGEYRKRRKRNWLEELFDLFD